MLRRFCFHLDRYGRIPSIISRSTIYTPHNHRYITSWLKRVQRPSPRIQDKLEPQIIMEEGESSQDRHQLQIRDLKHYMKTTDIPNSLRARILSTKLTDLINDAPSTAFTKDILQTIDKVFTYLHDHHGGDISTIILIDDLLELFRKTFMALQENNIAIPEYMATLAQLFLKSELQIPSEIYALIIDLAASLKLGDFEHALNIVAYNARKLPSDFTEVVLEDLKLKGRLNIGVFEALLTLASNNSINIVNDSFCTQLCSHVEEVFKDEVPNIHEYENLDKHIYRIQELTFKTMSFLSSLSTISLLRLFNFFKDINLVVEYRNRSQGIASLIHQLESRPFDELIEALEAQDLLDESWSQTLLLEISKSGICLNLQQNVAKYIAKNDVRFSAGLRLQAELLLRLSEFDDGKNIRLEEIQKILLPFQHEDIENAQDKIVEALILSDKILPNEEFLYHLQHYFKSNFDELPGIDSFISRIEAAVRIKNVKMAINIFEESLKCETVHWDHDSSPRTQLALNKLISLVCEDETSIMDLFPTFQKIKQHMTTPCNAEAIQLIAKKMLEEECVGDVIELLKRELPTMNSESHKRIPLVQSWAYSHRQLFEIIQNFCITYVQEETYETNWVLYGELHKYFAVPFDTYLPTMKFFCEKQRLHAALVIFQRIKLLNELHGAHHHLPPSREMYMYLFKTFGDHLYEQGVIELHEYLKMDINLPATDIDLQNCVLDAYSNLQNVGKARDLFLAISSNVKSEGGVNEETARIMIKTYTYSDMMYVKKFWNNLSHFGIYPDYGLFKQYVIAHVYHGHVEEAFDLVRDIDDYNIELSSELLLAMHNYCLDPEKQQKVIEWAAENHKEEWDKVCQSGLLRRASKYMPDSNLITGGK